MGWLCWRGRVLIISVPERHVVWYAFLVVSFYESLRGSLNH